MPEDIYSLLKSQSPRSKSGAIGDIYDLLKRHSPTRALKEPAITRFGRGLLKGATVGIYDPTRYPGWPEWFGELAGFAAPIGVAGKIVGVPVRAAMLARGATPLATTITESAAVGATVGGAEALGKGMEVVTEGVPHVVQEAALFGALGTAGYGIGRILSGALKKSRTGPPPEIPKEIPKAEPETVIEQFIKKSYERPRIEERIKPKPPSATEYIPREEKPPVEPPRPEEMIREPVRIRTPREEYTIYPEMLTDEERVALQEIYKDQLEKLKPKVEETKITPPIKPEEKFIPPVTTKPPVMPPEPRMIEKSVLDVEKKNLRLLEEIRDEVSSGEAGYRFPVKDEAGYIIEWRGVPSTFPEYFKNKGWAKEQVLNALNKTLREEKITPKQQGIISELISAKRDERLKQVKSLREARIEERGEPINLITGDLSLKPGDRLLINNEWLTVKSVGKGEIKLGDGQTITVDDTFEFLPIQGGEKYGVKRATSATSEVITEKEPWEMTFGEYYKKRQLGTGVNVYDRAKIEHWDIVHKSFQEKKPIPPEVLKDYPDLAKQIETAPKPKSLNELFEQKGWTEAEIGSAINNAQRGKKLTEKEQEIINTLESFIKRRVEDIKPIRGGAEEMESSDYAILELAKDVPPQVKNTIRRTIMEIESPYKVFSKDPVGETLWWESFEANKAEGLFLQKEFESRMKSVPLKWGTESGKKIGEALEDPSLVSKLTPQEQSYYNHIKSKWEEYLGILQKNFPKEFPPGRKIKDYMFRIHDKNQIYKMWQEEYERIMAEFKASGELPANKFERLDALEKSIKKYEETGTVLYDVIPQNVDAAFFHKRTDPLGRTYYEKDAVKSLDVYTQLLARKLHTEPFLKQSVKMMKYLPTDLKEYTRWYLRRYAGLEGRGVLDQISKTITGLEYIKDLGWNLRSAITNATQNINTIVEIGPEYTQKGFRGLFSDSYRLPNGAVINPKQIWKESGHLTDVPGMYYEQVPGYMQKANDIAMYLFNKVEYGNRGTAYLGSYIKALEKGKALPRIKQLMDKGMSLDRAARKFADEVTIKTQFMYGRVGMPKLLTTAGGRIIGQYSSFTIKQIELFSDWIKNNPSKFITYVMAAEGLRYGAMNGLGIDMSMALGIGVDWPELFKGMYQLSQGDIERAKAQFSMALPAVAGGTGTGGGIFPSGLAPAIQTLRNLYNMEFSRVLPVQAQRMIKAGQTLAEGEVPGKGYPVRTGRGELSRYISPEDLLKQVTIGKPTSETELFKQRTMLRVADQIRRGIQKSYADAVIRNDLDSARKYQRQALEMGIPQRILNQEVQRVRKQRILTPEERKRVAPYRRAFEERLLQLGESEEN